MMNYRIGVMLMVTLAAPVFADRQEPSSATVGSEAVVEPDYTALEKRVADIEARLRQPDENDATEQPRRGVSDPSAYAMGKMMADIAVETLSDMEEFGLSADRKQLVQGFTDRLDNALQLDEPTLMTAYKAISDKAQSEFIKRENGALAHIANVARTKNTLEKKDRSVWIGNQKGQQSVLKNQPLVVSYSVQKLEGVPFVSVKNREVKFDATLSKVLHKGISLAGKGGHVELYILASELVDDVPMPETIKPYDVIQYSISVAAQ